MIDIQIRDATPEELKSLFRDIPAPLYDPVDVAFKSREIIEKTVNHPHEPMVPDHREESLARAVIPSDELPKKEPVKKKRGSKGNKYGIPSELRKTDKKRYDVLWQRCKLHGITYEEALKRDGMKGGRTTTKTSIKSTNLVVAPTEEIKKEPVPKPAKTVVKRSSAEKTVEKSPAVVHNVATPPSQSDCNNITMDKAPASEIVTGIHVRQIRPDNGRQFFGVGTVVARERNGELIHVRNGGGKIHKIDAHCLELVTSPEVKG